MVKTQYRKGLSYFSAHEYVFCYWKDFDFSVFDHVYVRTKGNKKRQISYADLIIMADTETSRKDYKKKKDNHICAWSIAFRAYGYNICTLYGQNPYEFPEMLEEVRRHIKCDEIYLHWHNMAYDWVFLRRFLIEKFGEPKDQLNTKPLYPLIIKFNNGYVFKDTLALAQKKLESWAKDLGVAHMKAVGSWDYEKLRNQSDILSEEELKYIECDVLAGVECLDATCAALKVTIGNIPYTSTGIVRKDIREAGRSNKAHDWFKRIQPDNWDLQSIFEQLFAGGYTHGNRNILNFVFPSICYDEGSAYPFAALTEKYPGEKFWKLNRKVDPYYILKNGEDYAFIFKMKVWRVELQDKNYPMPYLAKAKHIACENPIVDNGRVLSASYFEIYYNEIDLEIFCSQYKWEKIEFEEVYCAYKEYLPKWYTDYIFKRFELKTKLKGKNKVDYMIEKGKLNACAYGLIAQRPVKDDIIENYETGEYRPITLDMSREDELKYYTEKYNKYMKSWSSVLPYVIAPWVTSYSRKNLFLVGSCVADRGIWLYSDTDSVYATAFNEKKIAAYNNRCKKKLTDRGYGAVEHNGREYWLGVLEKDGEYMQTKVLHSKCYCTRPLTAVGDNFVMGGDLKITVAGVPKKGAASLKNNIDNFKTFFCFDGKTSGKLGHTHIYVDKIYKDKNGNWTGDSIDLAPADYIVKDPDIPDYDMFDYMDVEVQIYDEDL